MPMWSHCLWKCSEKIKMWCLEIWFSGEDGRAGSMVGPDDLRGFFQPG